MVSQLFETIGKCQVQSDNLAPLPEPMSMVIKYQISIKLAGNLRIVGEPYLKMAADRLFLSVVAILKLLNLKLRRLCYIKIKIK